MHDMHHVTTPTVEAHRYTDGWMVIARPRHDDDDWITVVRQIGLYDHPVNEPDMTSYESGHTSWWVPNGKTNAGAVDGQESSVVFGGGHVSVVS